MRRRQVITLVLVVVGIVALVMSLPKYESPEPEPTAPADSVADVIADVSAPSPDTVTASGPETLEPDDAPASDTTVATAEIEAPETEGAEDDNADFDEEALFPDEDLEYSIKIRAEPLGAVVTVDGKRVGKNQVVVSWRADARPPKVVVSKPGHEPQTVKLRSKDDGTIRRVRLQPQ